MQYSAIVNIFIVKIKLNSAFKNDLKRKDFFRNVHSCRLSLFKSRISEDLSTRGFSSIYREVDNPQKWFYHVFIYSFKHKLWARKMNVSMRRFFYAPKTHVIIDS